MKESKRDHIVVCVGTIHRPRLLKDNLDSLSRLICPDGAEISILVIDNSDDGSARVVVDGVRKDIPYAICFVQEINRGIVFMRNRALDEAAMMQADYLAFIDDDEKAEKDWILELYQGLKKHHADVVQGSTFRNLPQDIPNWLTRNRLLLLRNHATGALRSSAATRNVLIDFAFIKKHQLRFHMAFNLMGSSDSFFFRQAYQKGAKIVWIDEARVIEEMPETRISFEWIMQRAYRAGHTHYEMKRQAGDKLKMFLEILKKAFYLWFMTIIALLVFPFSKSLSVKILRLSVIAFGFFRRAFGFNYLEYNKIHGD